MVDFQSRDTRRSHDSDDGEADASAEEGDGQVDADDQVGADDRTDDADQQRAAGGPGDGEAAHDHHDGAGTHAHHSADLETVSAAILTVSSSRTIEEDTAGDAIVAVLEGEGHEIATRDLVNDDYDGVQSAVDSLVSRDDVDAVVVTGGTGVSPDDVTPEAVRPLFDKPLPGFGETFRALSREEIGTRAIATRALAGIADGVPVFCLPGSEAGARLGTESVIAPEVGHLAGLSRLPDDEE